MASVDELIKRAQALLLRSSHAVALTGAGISTPSGIPDFRSANSGLWNQADPLEVASIYAFRRRPQDFYDWIHPLAKLTLEAQPNAAHLALAQLERHGPLRAVVTQNIDMLHTRAGSRNIYEAHGHLREVTCLRCYNVYQAGPYLSEFIDTGHVPHCEQCGGVLKPNVILFGEQLPVQVLNEAKKHSRACDVMLVAGSSLEVAPVGDLPFLAAEAGAHLIIVNYEPTHIDHLAEVVIHADVVQVLPQLAAPFLIRQS
ncbi:MAG: NAD-dependent deacylase [Chloroflexi bacterium]|nr:NAD-dependent deacylase [Chloroflexota bacterium]MCI0643881.1 NAD-dependent deacylase [Chloroflexota bacterium]MCI0729209.1 NAD-dependent deacylase [Chloroflexota bacterium]